MPMETLGLPSTIHCRNRTPMVAVEAAKVLFMNTREATFRCQICVACRQNALFKEVPAEVQHEGTPGSQRQGGRRHWIGFSIGVFADTRTNKDCADQGNDAAESWRTKPPAKSWIPICASQPDGFQTQLQAIGYTIPLHQCPKAIRVAGNFALSSNAPPTIAATVDAKMVWIRTQPTLGIWLPRIAE